MKQKILGIIIIIIITGKQVKSDYNVFTYARRVLKHFALFLCKQIIEMMYIYIYIYKKMTYKNFCFGLR